MNGDGWCRFWQPVQADSQPKSSGLVLGRRLVGAVLHSSNEPGELSQWLCNDDSTINIVLGYYIIIIINCNFTLASSSLHLCVKMLENTVYCLDIIIGKTLFIKSAFETF